MLGKTCSRWTCLAGLCRRNHLSGCEFRQSVVVFFIYSNVLFTGDMLSKNLLFE